MADSPNLSQRKNTNERSSNLPRRTSEYQNSPFRYIAIHSATKRVRLEAHTPTCNRISKKRKYSDSRSTWTMISSASWELFKNGSKDWPAPMEWSTLVSTLT